MVHLLFLQKKDILDMFSALRAYSNKNYLEHQMIWLIVLKNV